MASGKKSIISSLRAGDRPSNWNPLDNAAKIFPPTSHGADSGVFRFSCELNEPVQEQLLSQALTQTLALYPHMQMVLRRGVFWYYLEQSASAPHVLPEHAPVCYPLYHSSHSPLFEVSYWKQKINLEIYHVLTDGSGAIAFFRALIIRYLALCHPQIELEDEGSAPVYARQEDSFQRYYQKENGPLRPVPLRRAYHIKGPRRTEGGLSVIEGVADVASVLRAAHRYQTTLTVYLCSVLFLSIYDEMYVRDRVRPVVLTVPVDLRNFFPSDTGRNFFGTFAVSYDFTQQGADFSDVIGATAQAFRERLTPQHMRARMNELAALEHQPIIRSVPLFLKNPIMRFAGYLCERGETAVLSNVGRIALPAELAGFVRGIGAFMSTNAIQLCTCTYADKIHFGFTSVFANPVIQRNFFTRLVADGIDVEIRSNEHYMEEEKCNSVPPVK